MRGSREPNRSWMVAVAFAEAGEWDTARAVMPAGNRKVGWLQKMFTAVAFAEAGLHGEALRLMDGRQEDCSPEGFLEAVGLGGARVTYGVLTIEAV